MLKQSPGFQGYYVFDAGNGIGGSVTLFDSSARLHWRQTRRPWLGSGPSMADLVQGEPEITTGEVLATVMP